MGQKLSGTQQLEGGRLKSTEEVAPAFIVWLVPPEEPTSPHELKRGYARILWLLLTTRQMSPEMLVKGLARDFDKTNCTEEGVAQILSVLLLWGFVDCDYNELLWFITSKGKKFIGKVMHERKDILRESTSPNVPCYA